MKAEKPQITKREAIEIEKAVQFRIKKALAESEARIKNYESRDKIALKVIKSLRKQLGEASKLFNGMKASHDALAKKLIGKDDHIEQLQIAYKQLSDSDMERINEKDNTIKNYQNTIKEKDRIIQGFDCDNCLAKKEKERTIKALRDDLDLQIDYTRNAYQLGRKDAQGDELTENDKVIEAAYFRGFKEGRDEAEAEKDKEIAALKRVNKTLSQSIDSRRTG